MNQAVLGIYGYGEVLNVGENNGEYFALVSLDCFRRQNTKSYIGMPMDHVSVPINQEQFEFYNNLIESRKDSEPGPTLELGGRLEVIVRPKNLVTA